MFKDAGKNIGFFIICFLGLSWKKKKKIERVNWRKKRESAGDLNEGEKEK